MEYEKVVEEQREFFKTGVTRDYEFRLKALKGLKDSLVYYEEDIKLALKKDLNKSSYESYMSEYGVCLRELNLTIRKLRGWMKKKIRKTGLANFLGHSYELVEPYGNVLIISPWNYPFQLTISPLIGAIASGNTVVLKPSAQAKNTSNILKKIIETSFEARYVKLLDIDRDSMDSFLDKKFDYIFFTGSVEVGKKIMKKASQHLTPVSLELGGKSPCIVTGTADIDLAARSIAFGKILNSGQTCIAPDYILVDEKIREDFLARLKVEIEKMLPDPSCKEDYPSIINQRHFDRLENLLGEEDIYYGGRTSRDTLQIEPTIVLNPSLDRTMMKEEIFGPIFPILSYKSLEEALRFVEAREKPLALYLFTKDKMVKREILERLSFGGGCINDTIMHIMSEGLSFGGVGSSGMGKYHGYDSFLTFSNRKGIYEKSSFIDLPLRYQPYKKRNEGIIRKILK